LTRRSNGPFKGRIGKTYKDSKVDFPDPVTPPEDAPNVLIVLIDDLGFGGSGEYGRLIPTPNFDRVANLSCVPKSALNLGIRKDR